MDTRTQPLRGLDICAGSGIGSWAFEQVGFARTVCYVEHDAYCQRLLQARMSSGDLAPAPIWDNLKTFDGAPWRGCVDIIFGGIPCQPYSCAGKQQGADDARDLWPDFRRVLGEVGPRLALIENVAGFVVQPDGLRRVVRDLAEDGWSCVWTIVSAADAGAPHLRKRVWILAYPQQSGAGLEEHRGGGQGRKSTGAFQSTILRQANGTACAEGAAASSADALAYPSGPRLAQRRGVGGDQREEQPAAQRGGAEDVADAALGEPRLPDRFEGGRVLSQEVEIAEGVRQADGRMFPTPKGSPSGPDFARAGREGSGGDDLATMVARETLWRTPSATVIEPKSSVVKLKGRTPQDPQVGLADQVGGQLNPGFVEWLMGWPRDWTDPDAAPDASHAGDWSQEWEGVPRVAVGVKDRVNRLKVLGNGWVPQAAALALETLLGMIEQ